RLHEAFLDRVERVGLIAQESMGHPVSQGAITTEQLFQGLALAACQAREQALITGGRQTWCGSDGHRAVRTPQETDARRGSLIHLRFYSGHAKPQAEVRARTRAWRQTAESNKRWRKP